MKRVLKDHFIPHAGNDYSPHILQRAAMTAMLGLVLLSFTMANLHALLWLNVDWLVSAVLPAVVVSETNDERADNAIAPLARNPLLDRAAQLKAEHMAELGYFAHYAPDGTSPWYWFRSSNYSFVHAGENLAVHFNDSREVVRAWMNSPTHRANIMNGNFTEIGIGIAEGEFEGYDTVFVVQMFGTPAQVAAAPTPDTVTVVTEQVTEPVPTPSPLVAAAEESVIEEPVMVSTPEPEPVAEVIYTLPDTTAVSEELAEEVVSEASSTDLAVAEQTTTTPTPTPEAEKFISTSTNAVPATVASEPPAEGEATPLDVLATSPQTVLQVLYVLLSLFVVAALMLSIVIEVRRQNPVQIAYSFGLLAVMGGLYYLQTLVTTGATII
ncbi:hypothetical protein CL655_03535 [bacterium]|nr:hypothetical protein [bacterium]